MDHDQGIESVRHGGHVAVELDELEVRSQPRDGGGWPPPRSPITEQAKKVIHVAKPHASKESKRQNPYARPFGRLSKEELEQQITDTEVAIAEHQMKFGDAGTMKDQRHARRLQDDYQSLSKKLEALEAEYFEREK